MYKVIATMPNLNQEKAEEFESIELAEEYAESLECELNMIFVEHICIYEDGKLIRTTYEA